jgi:hypothetical protein
MRVVPVPATWMKKIKSHLSQYHTHTPFLALLSPLRVLAYADDIALILRDPKEWHASSVTYNIYSSASNAKHNKSKTEAISLNRASQREWQRLCTELNIQWHDRTADAIAVYLGYPLYCSMVSSKTTSQNDSCNIHSHLNILQQRGLSLRGKVLVANFFVLSKLWHVANVVIPPTKWITTARSRLRNYILLFWSAPSIAKLERSRSEGGLGILNLQNQIMTLQRHLVLDLLK